MGGECSGTKGKSSSSNSENTNISHCNTDTERFEQFHQELSMILTRENGSPKVLIVGSDMEFICSDGVHTITVERLVKGKERPLYIRYGEEIKVNCSVRLPGRRENVKKMRVGEGANAEEGEWLDVGGAEKRVWIWKVTPSVSRAWDKAFQEQ